MCDFDKYAGRCGGLCGLLKTNPPQITNSNSNSLQRSAGGAVGFSLFLTCRGNRGGIYLYIYNRYEKPSATPRTPRKKAVTCCQIDTSFCGRLGSTPRKPPANPPQIQWHHPKGLSCKGLGGRGRMASGVAGLIAVTLCPAASSRVLPGPFTVGQRQPKTSLVSDSVTGCLDKKGRSHAPADGLKD